MWQKWYIVTSQPGPHESLQLLLGAPGTHCPPSVKLWRGHVRRNRGTCLIVLANLPGASQHQHASHAIPTWVPAIVEQRQTTSLYPAWFPDPPETWGATNWYFQPPAFGVVGYIATSDQNGGPLLNDGVQWTWCVMRGAQWTWDPVTWGVPISGGTRDKAWDRWLASQPVGQFSIS